MKTKPRLVQKVEHIQLRDDNSFCLVVVSDTHSKPHHRAHELIRCLQPDAILHAGDVGDLTVLDNLGSICPVYAVHGNIDQHSTRLPDTLILEVHSEENLVLRILTLHIGVYGAKLRSEARYQAQVAEASVVVCGHSHIPFIAKERGIVVFNPGSIGPRRIGLPIVFGVLQISGQNFRLKHIDCETGELWKPPFF